MSLKDENQKTVTSAFVKMRRETTRKTLHSSYLPYYDALCAALEDTFWAPYVGFRSIEEQKIIWNQGRTPESIAKKEPIITYAIPGSSPHNYGCATDWAEFKPDYRGTDIWNKADWSKFSKAVRDVGLIWGGDFKKFKDKPHCELPIKVSWSVIAGVYNSKGKDAAIKEIELLVRGK